MKDEWGELLLEREGEGEGIEGRERGIIVSIMTEAGEREEEEKEVGEEESSKGEEE